MAASRESCASMDAAQSSCSNFAQHLKAQQLGLGTGWIPAQVALILPGKREGW